MKNWIAKLSIVAFMAMQTGLFAQAEEVPPSPPDQGFWQTFALLAIFIAFFYLILWRPEQKRRKALEQQRSALKKGDRVIAMGIIGTIIRVDDQSVIVKMYDGAKLEFVKGAISEVLPEGTEGTIEVKDEAKS